MANGTGAAKHPEVASGEGGALPQAPQAMVLIGSDPYRSALEPRGYDEALRFAEGVASRGLFGLKSEAEALSKIMFGRSLGINAVLSLQSLHSIEGKIGMDASLMMALCLRATNICEYFEPVLSECTVEKAVFVTKRVNRPEQRFEFTIEDARRMGVVDRGKDDEAKKKNNWNTSPRDMLMARCKAKLARQVFPDILHSVYSVEELRDTFGDPDEMIGEVVPATASPPVVGVVTTIQTPKRDYAKEADAFVDRFKAAATKEERAVVLAEFNKWDGVEPYTQRVKDAYNASVTAAKKAKAEASAQAAPTASPAPAPPAAAPQDAPAANAAPLPDGNLFGQQQPKAEGK